MKKYLLAVLALGATMMMACNPDDSKGEGKEPEPEVKADYTLSTNVLGGYLDLYGDDYEIGLNDYILELDVVNLDAEGNPVSFGIFVVEYLCALDNTTGLGSFTSSGPDWYTLENLQPNTYFTGVDLEGELYGSAYAEMDIATESITVVEGIVDGTLTVSMSGEDYVVKGTLKTTNNKVVKVDYTGALEFGDYAAESSPAPLSVKKSVRIGKSFSSVSKFLKK
ncbi:MAG: hypothetical protein J6C94_07145 [Alistipes sp.]|nr:hypothetical protein [Alistipes sp.]